MGAEAFLPGADPAVLDRVRATPLPSGRHEDWRFFGARLNQLAGRPWRFAPGGAVDLPASLAAADGLVVDGGHLRGGEFAPGELAGPHDLDALNAAGAQAQRWDLVDGQVLVLVNVIGASDSAVSHVRRTLTLGAGEARVVEVVLGGGAEGFGTQFTRYDVGAGARLTVERVHLGGAATAAVCRAEVSLGAGAEATVVVAQLGGRLSRDEVAARFTGSGAAVTVRSLSFPSAGEHHDLPVYVQHEVPGCTSRLDLRGLIAPAGRFVTNGRVVVHRGAIGTDADQQSRNLLLGDDADLHAKPELLIFCDDLRAAHGNAIGAIDPGQVHYLRSRGIPESEARLLIVAGFAELVLAALGPEVSALAHARLSSDLAQVGAVA